MYQLAMALMCVSSLYLTLTPAADMMSGLFKVAYGYKMTGATPLKNITSPTLTRVLCALFCVNDCSSATYNEKNRTCTTYGDKFYAPAISWSKDPDWCILYRNELIQYGDWTMVFRAQRGINASFYNLWESGGYSDDLNILSDFPIGCYRLDNRDTCTRHFRSALLDNWVNIDQVRFSLYTNGTEVAYIVFNGSSTTRQSWYLQGLILESSWTFLKNDASVKHFDFKGFIDPYSIRRMAIGGDYMGCDYDKTYFMAIDLGRDVCTDLWPMPMASYPTFVYSPFNNRMVGLKVPSEYKLADVMAIFVKQTTTSAYTQG